MASPAGASLRPTRCDGRLASGCALPAAHPRVRPLCQQRVAPRPTEYPLPTKGTSPTRRIINDCALSEGTQDRRIPIPPAVMNVMPPELPIPGAMVVLRSLVGCQHQSAIERQEGATSRRACVPTGVYSGGSIYAVVNLATWLRLRSKCERCLACALACFVS